MGALAQSEALAEGSLTAVALMEATLARIEAVNRQVNAIVSLRSADVLMAEARAADAAPRSGWLHGIPMAIKDLADAKGLPTSMGSPLFAGTVAQKDSVVVGRLRAAGAIIIGKTTRRNSVLVAIRLIPCMARPATPMIWRNRLAGRRAVLRRLWPVGWSVWPTGRT